MQLKTVGLKSGPSAIPAIPSRMGRSPLMERLIFHIDVNSAFLSWEAARRGAQGEADLRLIPSAIGGDPEKRTGVVLAKSIPAKNYGVRTGEPIAMALRKCPALVLAKPDFRLYERNSKAFMDICRRYAPVVEKFSIDECFLDMSGTGLLYPEPVAIAHTIKDAIREALGFTVNVGIGANKLTAKMASDFEKPDKVHTLLPEEIPAKLWPLPVGELFSVGRATAGRLEKARIRTVGDLAHTDVKRVQDLVGVKLGGQLHAFANGIDDSPVLAQPEEAKGYSISTTLEEDVTTAARANQILLALSDSVAARMRGDGAKASCVAVTIRTNTFQTRSHQQKLYEPTDITSEIYALSRRLFAELWEAPTPLRLLGISLTEISHGEAAQISLFTDEKREKFRRLDQTLDALRSRYGMDTIRRGSAMQSDIEVGKKYRARLEEREEQQ